MNINLKPCPFCGKEISHYSFECADDKVTRLQISCCMDFDIETNFVKYKSLDSKEIQVIVDRDVVAIWNTRIGE